MHQRLVRLLRRQEGGIATYVAQAVLIVAVLSVAFAIIGATTNLGRFMTERIYEFMAQSER